MRGPWEICGDLGAEPVVSRYMQSSRSSRNPLPGMNRRAARDVRDDATVSLGASVGA